MKKTLGLTACCLLMASGCGGMDQQRWNAWKEVEISKNQAIREKKETGGIELSFTDSGGKPVNFSVKFPDFGNTCREIRKAAPMPKGIVAESLEATGYVIREVGHAPATLIWGTGEAIAGVMALDKSGTHINAENVRIEESYNDTEVHATGEGNTSSSESDIDTEYQEIDGEE